MSLPCAQDAYQRAQFQLPPKFWTMSDGDNSKHATKPGLWALSTGFDDTCKYSIFTDELFSLSQVQQSLCGGHGLYTCLHEYKLCPNSRIESILTWLRTLRFADWRSLSSCSSFGNFFPLEIDLFRGLLVQKLTLYLMEVSIFDTFATRWPF